MAAEWMTSNIWLSACVSIYKERNLTSYRCRGAACDSHPARNCEASKVHCQFLSGYWLHRTPTLRSSSSWIRTSLYQMHYNLRSQVNIICLKHVTSLLTLSRFYGLSLFPSRTRLQRRFMLVPIGIKTDRVLFCEDRFNKSCDWIFIHSF